MQSSFCLAYLATPNIFEPHLRGNNMIVEELLEIKTSEESELRDR
jgi:hypothetical protein